MLLLSFSHAHQWKVWLQPQMHEHMSTSQIEVRGEKEGGGGGDEGSRWHMHMSTWVLTYCVSCSADEPVSYHLTIGQHCTCTPQTKKQRKKNTRERERVLLDINIAPLHSSVISMPVRSTAVADESLDFWRHNQTALFRCGFPNWL